jgi:hypothetical protein
MLALNSPATPPSSVNCPAGDGTVRCSASGQLQPGPTTKLIYHLVADNTAKSGTITGNVTAGAGIALAVRVTVRVTPPAPVDDVSITNAAGSWWWNIEHGGTARVVVSVHNAGTSTAPVTVKLTETDEPWDPYCSGSATSAPMAPGSTTTVPVTADCDWPGHLIVTATLGSDTSGPIDVRMWPVVPPCHGHGGCKHPM